MPGPDDQRRPPDGADRTDSGVPTSGAVVPDRFSSDEVFQRIVADADHEITSSTRELFFSALAGGLAITITVLVYVSMYPKTDSSVVAALLYPIGFVYIIIGGYQLYTENTLPPVALTLERLASVPALLRHWVIVLLGNFTGGAIGAIALVYGGVLDPEAAAYAAQVAHEGIATPWWDLFFKGAFAGLVVAGVVWVDFAARDTISRVVVVYLAFLTIPLGNLFHSVVSFTEAVYLVLQGEVVLGVALVQFVLPVLLGNTIGGIVLVTVVNYYQTSERRLESARFENVRQLSLRESLLGNVAGRSYVPVVDTIGKFVRDPDSYRILVPIANPRTESRLVELACKLASAREEGTVHVVHVVQAPREIAAQAEHGRRNSVTQESARLLADLEPIGDRHDVAFESSTIVTPRSFEEIFDRARRTRPDLVLLGWDEDQLWASARAERPIDELTNKLPCDFLVVKDRGLEDAEVLLPTAGGPNSALSAEVARALHQTADSAITLLHVVEGPDERAAGEAFLDEWAAEQDLEHASAVVDDSGDVGAAIQNELGTSCIVLLGATERGLLSRLVTDSLHLDVVDEADCSIAMAERPTDRSLFDRLFGSGRRDQ